MTISSCEEYPKSIGRVMSPKSADSSNLVIEKLLIERAKEFEGHTDSDVIGFSGQLAYGADDVVRDAIEGIDEKRSTVSFLLETPGGYLSPVQRIADTLRHFYDVVNFYVPNLAMSAGTVLVMCGDAIYMDYYSMLGPIDPQVDAPDGKTVSAVGYLRKFDGLVDRSKSGNLTSAELAFMLNKFDPGTLYQFEQERLLSISLVTEWLAKYKFKNWTETETKKTKVTDELRLKRAEEIGLKLSDPDLWHSHGRGIPKKTLEDEINLKIEDFSENTDLQKRTKTYFDLLRDYWHRRGHHRLVVHTRNGYDGW